MVRAEQHGFVSPQIADIADKAFVEEAGLRSVDWRKKMSDHIAYALLVYTALQIFVTMGALRGAGGSLLPYLALIILVIAIIPACRNFERRWNRLDDIQAHDPALAPSFRHDRMWLWLLAVGLPFALTALFKGMAALFS